jgi:putative membrane protein
MSVPPWTAHVDVWVVFASVLAVYFIAVRRHEARTGEVTSRGHRRRFVLAVAFLWVASDWPLHDLSEGYLYSAHMVQHMVFTLIAAPIAISGIPAWMWRGLLAPPGLATAWRFLTRPVVALIVTNGVLLFTHWPAVVDLSVRSALVHLPLHVLVVGTAVVFWWPVMSPLPEMPSLPAPGQMLYLFVQSLAPTIPASFLTFGHQPLYAIYATFPRMWGISVLDDQLMAGLIMKLIGGMILWGWIAAIFFRWGAREEREGFDALAHRDVHREIQTELSR